VVTVREAGRFWPSGGDPVDPRSGTLYAANSESDSVPAPRHHIIAPAVAVADPDAASGKR
jgi:hypothetical protein